MTTPIVICDDSGFARRQMARSLPDGWQVDISFAEHGEEALALIKQGKADVLFLDLNMPVMDGYQTMQAIKEQDLPTLVIVVSGDVQQEARRKMKAMGALDFIRKPTDNVKLASILASFGIYSGDASTAERSATVSESSSEEISLPEKLDIFREVANVAMGQAGEKLAQLLDVFIDLPIPNVNLIDSTELHMAIQEIQRNASVTAISQGYISAGINGEALLLSDEDNTARILELLSKGADNSSETAELEALLDVSNILVSACLNALSRQLDVQFSHNCPIVLAQHTDLEQVLSKNVSRWRKVLAIEIGYAIKSHNVRFDLLLLFPKHAMEQMLDRLVRGTE